MERLLLILISIALIAALFVISAANPIHSVFSLIRLFVRATGLLFTLQADFLAILLLVVYVGAIAVLFLFVIMMLHLNLNLLSRQNNLIRYLPIGIIIGFLFLLSILYISNNFTHGINIDKLNFNNYRLLETNSINIFADVLYSTYRTYFIITSLILFVAMIGAIVITQTGPTTITRTINRQTKKQDINHQYLRTAYL